MKAYDTTPETTITAAGVLRCCLASVAREHIGHAVPLGTKSACEYCRQPFTLAAPRPGKEHAVWLPDWQLDEK